jgi:hypothetical protein
MWIKGASGAFDTSIFWRIIFSNESGNQVGSPTDVVVPVTADWTQTETVTILAPTGATRVSWEINSNSSGVGSVILIDDIVMRDHAFPPMAAYAFNEGAGSTAAEVSGGTPIAGILGWATGLHESALRVMLDAGPEITPWSVDTAFTIMFDLYVNGAGANAYTVFLNDWTISGDSPFGNVQVTPGGNLDWYLGSGESNVPIPNGVWKHVALTADGVWRRSYVDGVLATQATNSNRSGTGPLRLGGFSGYEPNVRYDNLRIFDVALTQPEIAALAGTPVIPDSSGEFYWVSNESGLLLPASPLGWWDGSAIQPMTQKSP